MNLYLIQNDSMYFMHNWRDNFHAAHGLWYLPVGGALHPRSPVAPLSPDARLGGQSTPCSGLECQTGPELAAASSDSPVWSPSAAWSSDFWGCCRWCETGKPGPPSWTPAPCHAGRCCCPGRSLPQPVRSVPRIENRHVSIFNIL